jgi:acyl dehydratase
MFIVDALHVRLTVADVRRTRKGDRGVVKRHFELISQRDEVVRHGDIDLVVRVRRTT